MRCMTGTAYAAVLPDPVLARARRSLPSKAKGIAFSWIRVGWDQPRSATAWKKKVKHIHKSESSKTIDFSCSRSETVHMWSFVTHGR